MHGLCHIDPATAGDMQLQMQMTSGLRRSVLAWQLLPEMQVCVPTRLMVIQARPVELPQPGIVEDEDTGKHVAAQTGQHALHRLLVPQTRVQVGRGQDAKRGQAGVERNADQAAAVGICLRNIAWRFCCSHACSAVTSTAQIGGLVTMSAAPAKHMHA